MGLPSSLPHVRFSGAYLYVYLPETKGRTVEDITEEFKRKTGETVTDAKPTKPSPPE